MSKTLFPDKKHNMNPKSLANLVPGPKGLAGKGGRKKKVANILDELINTGMIPNVKNIQDLKDRAIAIQCAMMYSGDANLMMAAANKILEYTHPKGVNLSGNLDNNIIVSFNMPPLIDTNKVDPNRIDNVKVEQIETTPIISISSISEQVDTPIPDMVELQRQIDEAFNDDKDKDNNGKV